MDIMALAFTVGMTWFPYGFLAWFTSSAALAEAAPAERDAARRPLTLLLLASLACTLVQGAAAAVVAADGDGADTVFWFGGMVSFHVLWWPLVAPSLNRARGALEARAAGARPTERRASLRARRPEQYLPRGWWLVPSGIFVAGLTYVVVSALTAGPIEGGARLVVLLFLGAALSFLLSYGIWAHVAALGPQDLTGAPDPEALERALEDLRRFLVRGVFVLDTAAVAVFTAVAVLAAVPDLSDATRNTVGAWIGGGGGSLVGLLGGVFGTLASVRRIRAERLRGGSGAPDPAS